MASITPREALAQRVRTARDAAGVTDLELSEETHIARSTLQRKLAGAVDFTIAELDAIAEVLDLELTDLVGEYAAAKAVA